MSAPVPASAQDLTYFSTTTLEVSGALSRALSSTVDVDYPIAQLVCFKGSRVRLDGEDASSILDWSSGVQTFLDHTDRTFLRFDFTQMAGATAESPPRRDPAAGTSAEVTRTMFRTWRKDVIAGYAAEQLVLVVELKPQNAGGSQETRVGATVFVTDLWLSSEFPEYRTRREMAPEALAQYRRIGRPAGVSEILHALSGANALLARGWEESMAAVEELEGTVLHSVTHFVVLPPGSALDRAKVLEAAGEAVEEVSGLVRGTPRPTRQVVVMRVRTDISGVKTDAVADSWFDIPSSYRPKGSAE